VDDLGADEALVICDDIRDVQGGTVEMLRFWEEVSEGYDHFLNNDLHPVGIPMGFIRYVR